MLNFTGKERDSETGLDFFGARYTQGRFMSADSEGAKPEDPQSWNRYAYVTNNPLRYVDPGILAGNGTPERGPKHAREPFRINNLIYVMTIAGLEYTRGKS